MSGVKKALTRKLGPLPFWAWALIAGVGIYYFRNRGGGASSSATPPDTGGTTAPDLAQVAPAAPQAGVTDTSGADLSALGGGVQSTDLYPDNKLRLAAMGLIDQIRGIQDQLTSGDTSGVTDGSAGGGDGGGGGGGGATARTTGRGGSTHRGRTVKKPPHRTNRRPAPKRRPPARHAAPSHAPRSRKPAPKRRAPRRRPTGGGGGARRVAL